MAGFDAKAIQQVCLNHYNKQITKNGKAKCGTEWTVLSAIVMHQVSEDSYEVVSMGTGTKCIGQNLMCARGLIVNDSHAEVVARRSFLCFLYNEVEKSFGGRSSAFVFIDGKSELKSGTSFHFFTTHAPCGDAAIIDKRSTDGDSVDELCDNIGCSVGSLLRRTAKRRLESDDADCPSKLSKHEESVKTDFSKSKVTSEKYLLDDDDDDDEGRNCPDVHRTGAKCVETEDPMLPGVDYHLLGVLRTKPGRGDRTLSLSCSDKICRWNAVGLQGALLMHFLRSPIYLDSFVVSSKLYCQKAFYRATYKRISGVSNLPQNFKCHQPKVFHLKEGCFESRRQSESQIPSASSICWFASDKSNGQEVIARGRLLGLTKKNKNSAKSSCLSKASLFKRFLQLKSIYLDLCPDSPLNVQTLRTYLDYKNSSSDYQQAWTQLKENHLVGWPCASRNFYQFQ